MQSQNLQNLILNTKKSSNIFPVVRQKVEEFSCFLIVDSKFSFLHCLKKVTKKSIIPA